MNGCGKRRPFPIEYLTQKSLLSLKNSQSGGLTPHCNNFPHRVQINGSQGEWTGLDDMPPKASRKKKVQTKEEKKERRSNRTRRLKIQAMTLKQAKTKGLTKEEAIALGPIIRGRGDYSIGEGIGSKVGSWVGGRLEGFLRNIFGSGDYTLTAAAAPDIKENSFLAGSSVPGFVSNRDGSIEIEFHEFIGNLKMTVVPTLTTYAIDPTDARTFPWLSKIAPNFQQWELLGCLLIGKSLSSNVVMAPTQGQGSVSGSARYDVLSEPPTNKVTVLNALFSSSAKPSENQAFPLECAKSMTPIWPLKIRPPGAQRGDRQLSVFCEFDVLTEGAPNDYDDALEMWITYRIRLLKPRTLGSSGGVLLFMDLANDPTKLLTPIPNTPGVKQPRINTLGVTLESNRQTVSFPLSTTKDSLFLVCLTFTGSTTDDLSPLLVVPTGGLQRADVLLDQAYDRAFFPAVASNSGGNSQIFIGYFFYDGTGTQIDPPSLKFTLFGSTLVVEGGNLLISQVDSDMHSGLTSRKRPGYTRAEFFRYLCDSVAGRPSKHTPPSGLGNLADWTQQFKKTDTWSTSRKLPTAGNPFDIPLHQALGEMSLYVGPSVEVEPPPLVDFEFVEPGETKKPSGPVVRKRLNGNNGSYTGTDDHCLPKLLYVLLKRLLPIDVVIYMWPMVAWAPRAPRCRINYVDVVQEPIAYRMACVLLRRHHRRIVDQAIAFPGIMNNFRINARWVLGETLWSCHYGPGRSIMSEKALALFFVISHDSEGMPILTFNAYGHRLSRTLTRLVRIICNEGWGNLGEIIWEVLRRGHAKDNLYHYKTVAKIDRGMPGLLSFTDERDFGLRINHTWLGVYGRRTVPRIDPFLDVIPQDDIIPPLEAAPREVEGKTEWPQTVTLLESPREEEGKTEWTWQTVTLGEQNNEPSNACTTLNGNNGEATNTDDLPSPYVIETPPPVQSVLTTAVVRNPVVTSKTVVPPPRHRDPAYIKECNDLMQEWSQDSSDSDVKELKHDLGPNTDEEEETPIIEPLNTKAEYVKPKPRHVQKPCKKCGMLHKGKCENLKRLKQLEGKTVAQALEIINEPTAAEGDDPKAKEAEKGEKTDSKERKVLTAEEKLAKVEEIYQNLHDKACSMMLTKNFSSVADKKLIMQSLVMISRKEGLYKLTNNPSRYVSTAYHSGIRAAYGHRLNTAKELCRAIDGVQDYNGSKYKAFINGVLGEPTETSSWTLDSKTAANDLAKLEAYEAQPNFSVIVYKYTAWQKFWHFCGTVCRLLFSLAAEKFFVMFIQAIVSSCTFGFYDPRNYYANYQTYVSEFGHKPVCARREFGEVYIFLGALFSFLVLCGVEVRWVIKYSPEDCCDQLSDITLRSLFHFVDVIVAVSAYDMANRAFYEHLEEYTYSAKYLEWLAFVVLLFHIVWNSYYVLWKKEPWRAFHILEFVQRQFRGKGVVDVCLEDHPMETKPVQDGYEVEPGDPVCKEKSTVFKHWGIGGVVPTVFANCSHNEKIAMDGRVGKRLPMHESEDTRKAVNKHWIKAAKGLKDFMQEIATNEGPMDFEEWTASFPPTRRRELRDIRLHGKDMPELSAKSFIKVEIAPKLEENFVFKDPRFIQGCPLELSAAAGPHLRPWTKLVRDAWAPNSLTSAEIKAGKQIFYTCGRSNEEIGRLYGECLKLIEEMTPGERLIVLEDDQSRFDLHLTKGPFNFLNRVYRRCLKRGIANLLRRSVSRGTSVLGTKYKIPYTMQSGWPDTSVGDTIINAAMKTYIHGRGRPWVSIICGDDSVTITTESELARIGGLDGLISEYAKFGMEVDAKMTYEPEKAEFCSGRFYQVGDTYVLFPKPGRIFSKILCDTKIRSSDNKIEWLKSIASTLEQFGKIDPLMRSAAGALRRQIGYGEGTPDEGWEYKQVFDGTVEAKAFDAVRYYDLHYGLNEQQVVHCVATLGQLTLGEEEDDSVIRHLVEVDLA